jgi:adenylate cyclase
MWLRLQRHLATVGVALVLGTLTAILWPPESTSPLLEPLVRPLQQVEWQGYDLLFHWRGPNAALIDPRVVVVGASHTTGKNLDPDEVYAWPPPRKWHAKLLQNLERDGARAIVLDLMLSDPSRYGLKDDLALDQALAGMRVPVVLACRWDRQSGTVAKTLEAPYHTDDSKIDFERNDAFVRLGFAEVMTERELGGAEILRRAFPLRMCQDEWQPSLSAAALLAVENRPNTDASLKADTVQLGPYKIPRTGPTERESVGLDRNNELASAYLDFPAGAASFGAVVPYEQVARNEFAPGSFKNKVVFVGLTDAELTRENRDQYLSAYSHFTIERLGGQELRTLPGVLLHAQMFSALTRGGWMGQASPVATGLLVAVIALLASVGIRSFLDWRGPALVIAATLGHVALVFALFCQLRVYIPWVIPSALMLIAVAVVALSERGQLRRTWARYVSPAYMEEMLRAGSDSRPQRVGTATVLFGDIRGFTSFSENHPPELVVQLLDRHLDKLVKIVFDEGGSVDKFLGDGILAVFGVPRPLECAELAAVRAAFRMCAAARQAVAGSDGVPYTLVTGFGVTTGPLVFGMVGDREQRSLTLIGDTVNLASRLQAVTGEPDVIIDELTLAAVREHVEVEPLGARSIKGKAEAVACFKVISLR